MERYSLTKFMPDYERARLFLRITEGVCRSQYDKMWKDINQHRGTPQETSNWTDPDNWIDVLLTHESRALAIRIWHESERRVNPRYTDGYRNLSDRHQLVKYPDDHFVITEAGHRFLQGDETKLAKMDAYEGILLLLSEVAANGPCQKKDFLDSFSEFCLAKTTSLAKVSISNELRNRLNNLLQRNLVEKSRRAYQITDAGIAYISRNQDAPSVSARPLADRADVPFQHQEEATDALYKLRREINQKARIQLAQHLQNMDPFKFEHLIKELLEKMGYDDVAVTSPTNDKGIDVFANIQLGVSSVREVIQVKRQQSNVGRKILDSLRGSLHRFDAVRATIITTSGFSKGATEAAFEKGAAPITLIDGESLLDLLVEHNIGMRRRESWILEFDSESLSQFETEGESNLE